MTDPFIIMAAPNGARRQKTDHPALPITPHELALCAAEVCNAGASILHLHVRDEHNAHSLDVERYRAAIAAIRDVVGQDLIIQVTSEAVGQYSRFEQMAMVKALRPQAVSLALRELCPTDEAVSELARFVDWMSAEHIMPQYILYDEHDRQSFENYLHKGIFQNNTPFVLFVFGRTQRVVPENDTISAQMQERTKHVNYPWAVCGFEKNEHHAIMHAAQNNGHIRVGFENNIHQENSSLLNDHAQMIELCTKAALREGRSVAKPNDVKNLLNL